MLGEGKGLKPDGSQERNLFPSKRFPAVLITSQITFQERLEQGQRREGSIWPVPHLEADGLAMCTSHPLFKPDPHVRTLG